MHYDQMTRRTVLNCLCAAMLGCLSPAWSASSRAAEKPIKVLIITGFDVKAHNWRATTAFVRDVLEQEGQCDVRVSEDIGILDSPSLDKYDVIVLNYGFWAAPEPSAKGKSNLLDFVKRGKGLVALHFACSSFQEWDEYGKLLGRVWKKGIGGHGPRGPFTVKIETPDHPITRGIGAFEMNDELYARLSGDEPITVLASADSDWSKKTEPILWVKHYGKGRVVHNVLGHDVKARRTPPYPTLLKRSVAWAAGR